MDKKEIVTNEELHKEIDLIQSCITRMANNSFMLKGWLLTLIIAFIALLPENINRFYICLIVLLTDLAFWYLDAFFIKQEKLFKWKYDWVITKRLEGKSDFLYNLNPYEKDMWLLDKNKKTKHEPYVIMEMINKSLIPLYGGIFLLDILLIAFKYHL
jgi:hypothetical protein